MERRDFFKKAALGVGLFACGEACMTMTGLSTLSGKCNNELSVREAAYRVNNRQHGRQERVLPILPCNPAIQIFMDRCRRCGRCVDFCRNTMTVFGQSIPQGETPCIYCGQCTLLCSRAITEQYHYHAVADAIADNDKIVIATTAPAIRVALGEMYKLAPGTNVESKIVGSLKQLGVDHVLDTTFAADLTIMEEASELLQRLNPSPTPLTMEKESNDSKNLPMFTSCCPAWVRFAQLFYPNLLTNLSTAKSPVMMQGAMIKTYFAQKKRIDPTKIFHFAITPCTAKKAEILFPGMNGAGISFGKPEKQDVDVALTCRELAYLLNESNVDFLQAQDVEYSSLMGTGSGAGIIFGNTGGVMEAILRTAYKLLNDKNPPANFFDLQQVRNWDSVRQANIDLGKLSLNVAVVHGIGKIRPFIEEIIKGTQKYDFIEVMACTGGCIGGGGQPVPNINATSLRQQRMNALYQRDTDMEIRLSYDNPQIKAIYDEFLDKPLSEKSKELLHRK